MLIRTMLILAVLVLGVTSAVGTAQASPVTYAYTSGNITITASANGVPLTAPNTTIALSGNQATFDAAALQLTNFQFTTFGSSTIALTGAFAGEFLTLTNLNVIPGLGYSSFATLVAPGVYTFSATPVNATGAYALNGILGNTASTALDVNTPNLTGLIQTAADQFALTGISLGAVTVTQGAVKTLVTLKADIVFTGATPVPLPAPLWLFGTGLGLLSLPFVRRRRGRLL